MLTISCLASLLRFSPYLSSALFFACALRILGVFLSSDTCASSSDYLKRGGFVRLRPLVPDVAVAVGHVVVFAINTLFPHASRDESDAVLLVLDVHAALSKDEQVLLACHLKALVRARIGFDLVHVPRDFAVS